MEFIPQGVRVNAVAPGPIETDMAARMFGWARRLPRLLQSPGARRCRPDVVDDIAEAVLYLASPRGTVRRGTGSHRGRRHHRPLSSFPPLPRLSLAERMAPVGPKSYARGVPRRPTAAVPPGSTVRCMPNLSLVKMKGLSPFRKIALGTWRTAYDPSIYGTLVLRMDRALDYIERFRARTGRHLTVSHLMAKASAMALQACPEANAVLRWNRIYLRQRIGVFFQVLMTDEGEGKADLSGATLYDLERKSLLEIVDEFETEGRRWCGSGKTPRWRRRGGRSSGCRTSSFDRSCGCSPSSATR